MLPAIILGAEVPSLLVILQSGITQKFAITVQVEPEDLVGVYCWLNFEGIINEAVLDGTTYTWTFTPLEVAELAHRPSAILVFGNDEGEVILGRGIVEVRS